MSTMEACDEGDEDHKASLRKILEDFRRSLREDFRDSVAEADDQAGSVGMTATDVNTTSSGNVCLQTEHQPRTQSASKRAPGNKPPRTKSVLHDPRIMRQIRPLNHDLSLNNGYKQKLTNVDDQPLNSNQTQNMEQLEDKSSNNDHKQKIALDDDHFLQYDHKQKMAKPEDQLLTNDHKQMAQLDNQSLRSDHKQKVALVDVQSLHNDQKHEVVLVDDQSLTNDPKQKLASLDDQSLNNNHKQKLTSLDGQSSTDTSDAQTTGDISVARNSDSDIAENMRKNSAEILSSVDKIERRHVSDTDYTDDTTLAQRTNPATAVVGDVTSEPRQTQQFNSLCPNNTVAGLYEDHERLTPSSILSYDENKDVQSEPESLEGSAMCKTRTNGTRVDARQQYDHEHATPDDLTMDGSIMSQTEGGDTISNCSHTSSSIFECGESSDRQFFDTMGTPESVSTLFDDLPVYTGNTGSLIIPGVRSATPYFTGHVYGDSEDDTNDYGDEQTLEPGQSRVDQDGAKDDMGQSSDSGDLTEQLTASFSEHTGHLIPVTDDRSIQKDGIHSKAGDEYSSEASETPGHLNAEHSLMPCVLADCDGDNPGTADAQAQARAEQRKNSEVNLKFGSDGLHINTDNANDSSGHFQQQITPLQQKYSPLPQQLPPLYDPHYDRERAVEDANYHLNPYPTTYITSLPEFADSANTNSYGFAHVFEAGSNNGRGFEISQTDNRIIPFSSEENNSNSNLYELGEYEHNDRRRRLGRDHTNYVLPSSSLTFFKDNVNSDNSLGAHGTDHGPPGLPLIGDNDVYGEEAGLKLVVLDTTDDEDDFFHPSPHESGDHTRLYGSSYKPRSHNDVFPIDRRAIDRDLYKQVFDPTAEAVKTSRSASVHTLGANPSAANTNPGATNTFVVRGNTTQQEYNYQNNPTSAPGMLIHVTDYDTETGLDTGRTSLRSSAAQQHQSPISDSPNNIVAHGHLHEYYGQPHNQIARNSQINSATRQLYSMSQIDYDRYTSNASQLSVEHHDSYTDRSATFHKAHGRLSGIHPITQGPTHPSNEPGNHPEARVLGPGYKFQVNKYNVAKRASIVNRAEQLLDSRRGQFTDRSESSDELERIEEDDDEDFDGIDDMNGPRHRALKHLQRRVYDDSTSYNSSDDVLHNMRYPARGPVSQAARRARLTSVNARLKKQKRSRTTRRQQVRPPSPVVSDTEDSSSENDITEPRSSHKQLHDLNRYEEPNVVDPEKGDHLLHPNNSETTPGPVGRRVMFFRNGDIHYKPKQVLINNKTYTNLEKLLVDLSSMVETSTGVKYIFSWPEGREVKSITELENGKYYICSSTNKLQRVDYGNSKESQWKVGKIDRKDHILFKQTTKIQSPLRRPRVLTVISNMKRDSREKLILNTNSQMNFEDVLNDISNMINIPNPPVKALYTEKKPHLKVESYSQLMRDFADEDSFIACGEEMVPLEMSSIRSGQTAGGRGSRKPPTRNLMSDPQRIQEDPTTARSYEGTNTRDNAKVRRRKTDSVRVDINGRTREFFPPKQLDPNDDGQKPAKKLRLTWVYGYRGRDVKQNLAVLSSTEELVYFVAAVVVVYNKKLSSQKHYLGHSEEITCLAVHPNGRFIATGQTAGKTLATGAHVRIWDGVSLSTFAIIGLGTFQQGVACLNFSEKDVLVKGRMESLAAGDLLMTVDESDRHVLSVWEWQTEKLIARTSTTSEPVVSGTFYASDVNTLITYGKEHIHFWRMFWEKGGKIMRDKLSGNFQDTVPKYVTSICSAPSGDVISGDSSGAILVWTRDNNHIFTLNRNISAQTRRAHQKSVSALCMLGDGTLLSGGGNVLKAWDSINNYCLVKERVLPESAGHVRSIVPMITGGLDGSIYVATTRNKVLEGSLQLKFTVIVQGHVEELWAVECHPSEETFVSAGHDQAVVKWSAISHVPVWRVNVENPCTSISIDPRGRLIAVGTTAGKVVILNSSSGVQVTSLMSGTAQINALSFSPDGKQLAVGTFQGLIHIFHVQDDGRSFFRPHGSSLKGNGMFIMHLDWSMDSKMIQAAMGDYEVVIWNVITMQRIRSGSNLRDVKWASHNTPISYSTIGTWQNLDSGDVINVVCRSQGGDVQMAGDTSGRLRLYKWPCSVAKAGYRQTKVYSSNVTCASFTCDDKYLITSGGNDAALMQFSVLDTANAR